MHDKIQLVSEFPAGTSFHRRTVTVNPRVLLERYPDYDTSDQYKSTREWVFRFKGALFTVYDWKETSAYDPDYPSEQSFWARPTVTLHIGSAGLGEEEFIREFLKELGDAA